MEARRPPAPTMPYANDHLSPHGASTCPVCHDTGRAKMETIDDVAMVAWCRCPAGARALDAELAYRRGGGRSAPSREAPPPALREPPVMEEAPPARREPPALHRALATRSPEVPFGFRGGAVPALLEPEAIPLRAVHDHHTTIHVVSHDEYETRSHPRPVVAQLPDAHLIAVGCKADDRVGVMHYVTLRIKGERIDVPCDREAAAALANTITASRSLRVRISLESVE